MKLKLKIKDIKNQKVIIKLTEHNYYPYLDL